MDVEYMRFPSTADHLGGDFETLAPVFMEFATLDIFAGYVLATGSFTVGCSLA